MKTWLFPGQGSQHAGMGAELFDEFPELTAQADAILGYSIKTLCVEDPQQQLQQTAYTQPALYTVNALTYFQHIKHGDKPDFLAGHSLGEYNALLAAGAFDFVTGLTLVQRRAELMSQASGGAMAAVLNVSVEQIQALLAEADLAGIDIANYNSPSQTVISGLQADIDRAVALFEQHAVRCMRLKVSGAFHSRYMRPASAAFQDFLSAFEFNELKIPVIANTYALPYEQADIADNLVAQISHSVRWVESIHYLMAQGEMTYTEIGPGKVLTKLMKKIQV